MNPLQSRLAAFRRQLRYVMTVRGICWLSAVVLVGTTVAGLLDWRLHLPGLVRAGLLVGLLGGAGIVGYRLLLLPWRDRTDDLSLALRIERYYPGLNDALASTIQFLQQPTDSDQCGSPSLRQRAVELALQRVRAYDFGRVIDRRGLRRAGLACVLGLGLVLPLGLLFPAQSAIALSRLANPFGGREWPPQTQLAITARSRVAQGEPFEIHGLLAGVVPDHATVVWWFENAAPTEHVWTIKPGPDANQGSLHARLDADRVRRSFRFAVRANDADTGWQEVVVLPPPRLVPRDGRPSPQVRLRYPSYSDLPTHDTPDGTGHVEAVAGTEVQFRAAVDRPIARAWIEYRPDPSVVTPTAFLSPLGADHFAALLTLTVGSQSLTAPVPIRLDAAGTRLDVDFVPCVSGAYALRMEDETGLISTRLFDLRLQADPAPTVNLERPSQSLDSLSVLPTAEITVQALAEDLQYAVRTVYLEYRCRKDDPPRRWPLFDPVAAGRALPPLLAGFAAAPVALPTETLRLRPQRLQIVQRFSFKQLKHRDGSGLQEGDVITLQACADDYDNVAVDKAPGRSHEVEIRIIGQPALEALLNQAQAQIQQDVTRLREQQRDALKKVDGAEKQWRHTGKLRPEDLDNLVQAEQLQQQIKARVGAKPDEGLQADIARVRQMLQDNHQPRSGTHERMELAARELERLANEELEPIEPLLTEARKENELATPRSRDPKTLGPLSEARHHQDEVEKTFDELLARLEPWSKIRDVKAEAKSLLEEQHKLNRQTDRLGKDIPRGRAVEGLDPAQRAELDRAADSQARHAEHVDQMIGKMDRLVEERQRQAQERDQQAGDKRRQAEEKERQARDKELLARDEEKKDPSRAEILREEARTQRRESELLRREAEAAAEASRTMQEENNALRQAAAQGRESQVGQQMTQAAQELRQNRLGEAGRAQQAGTEGLQKVVQALDEKRENDLDRLAKRLRNVEQKMLELEQEQERLQKKVKQAQQLADPQQRQQELQKLAREQEQLRRKTQEMAQELTRLRAERAGQALNRASGEMEEAGQQLTRGQDAEEPQDDALDRLDEARRELQRAREQVEEELSREKLAKIADRLKRLKERQESNLAESERLHQALLQRKRWERPLLASLGDLARAQQGLAQETGDLAGEKLTGAKVVVHLLKKSAEAMTRAEERIKQRRQHALERRDQSEELDVPAETAADTETRHFQREALRRLEQILDVLQPEKGGSQRAGSGQGGMGQRGPESDGIPELAQLKLLRALQEEVNQRTEAFAKQHPDVGKLTLPEKAELDRIHDDQRAVAELLDQLTAPEGGTR